MEKLISELYFRDARRKLLKNPGLIRIGITGSYGKTTVKNVIGAILSEKYPTLITPASYNTPMFSPEGYTLAKERTGKQLPAACRLKNYPSRRALRSRCNNISALPVRAWFKKAIM